MRTTQPRPKKSAVKPKGMATRTGAEKSFQPQMTKEIAATKSRKMPRKSNACSVRSERIERHNHSLSGGRGGGGSAGLGVGFDKEPGLTSPPTTLVWTTGCFSTGGLRMPSHLAFS